MNKTLFASQKTTPVVNTVNKAGGAAYEKTVENALAQLVVTGTFNNTFYASAKETLDEIKAKAAKCSSEFLAKLAVYAAEEARMKDTPCFLLAVLCARGELDYVKAIFNRVCYNAKMLLNFVQMVRSGVTGRKSFGSAVKKLIQNWIVSRTSDKLFDSSVGHSSPSLKDVIAMVHPRPCSIEQNAIVQYILGKPYDVNLIPNRIKRLETFKKNPVGNPPNVDFRVLSNLKMSTAQWCHVAQNMPWGVLRQNLNTLNRHDVFTNEETVRAVVKKLSDVDEVKRSNAFPYQLLTTYQNTTFLPMKVRNAIQDAMEVATSNVPKFETSVAICVDVSGSMDSPVTGTNDAGTQTVTKCRDVASLIASVGLRNNEDCQVVAFHTQAQFINLNPRDSVMTNSDKLGKLPSGGTDCSSPLRLLNASKSMSKLVIVVSDYESWVSMKRGRTNYYGQTLGTDMQAEWETYKKRVKGAKLVLVDLQPQSTNQVVDSNDVLNIGGWSDVVWKHINNFASGKRFDFSDVVNSVSLEAEMKVRNSAIFDTL